MKTFLRSLSLAVTSAVTAEFLLGDQYLGGMAPIGQQVVQLVLYTAFYGSAAVLIREIARRTGHGWPSILTMALAFGMLEEGVLTQSLFNPNYVGAHLLVAGFIPWLGTAGPWLIFVLTLHVVWSIGSPIAVMEGAFDSAPWLKHAGWLAVPAVLFAIGGAAIFGVSALYGFMASAPQLLASVLIAAALVVVALLLPRRSDEVEPGRVGRTSAAAGRTAARYWISVAVAFVLTAAFQASYEYLRNVSPWLSVACLLVVLACGILFTVIARVDAAGLGTGAILTYCVVGLMNAGGAGSAAVIEQVTLVVIALAVLAVVAVRHLRGDGSAASNNRTVRRSAAGE